ncbi:MAG: alpha/beta hydrolase [Luteolibacter sp.]
MKPILIALLAVLPTLAFAADIAPDRSVVFKKFDETELKLHIFEPEGHQPTDRKPVIVFFFGGGWSGGTPTQFYQQAEELSEKGMVAISADYRVRSRNKTTPFEAVADAKSAIRWVRLHAKELGIDPDRIVASGGSAGGHVAACTGLIIGHENEDEDLSVSSVPNAMVLYNPVLDTTAKGYGKKSVTPEREEEISPCHHVKAGLPPTLVLHGTADSTVPFENAERFARLMKDAGNNCELIPFEGQEHGFFNSLFFRPNTKDLAPYEKAMKDTENFLSALGYLKD